MSENKKVMPDGDQYNGKIKGRYIKPYKMLCEDKFTANDIGNEILKNMRESLRDMGNDVFGYLQAIVNTMRSAFHTEALSKVERCSLANKLITQIRGHGDLSPRTCSMLNQAAKSYIHGVKYGNINAIGGEKEQILFHCLSHMYQAEFKEPVSQRENHHKGANHLTVLDKLSSIDQNMEQGFYKLAEAACKKQSVKNLRSSKREKNPVSFNENLL